MTQWYEKIAEDPEGSLRELAEDRGLSVEELHARHDRISAFFDTDTQEEHLTLNELTLFRMHSDQLSKERTNHVAQCRFCQVFVEGSDPAEVDRQIFEIERKFGEWSDTLSPVSALGSRPVRQSVGVSGIRLPLAKTRWLIPAMALCVGMIIMKIPLLGSNENALYAERVETLTAMAKAQIPSDIPNEISTKVLNTYTTRFYPNDNSAEMELLLSDNENSTSWKSAVAAADILSQYKNNTCQLGASQWTIADAKEEIGGMITLLLKEQEAENIESVGLRVPSAVPNSWQVACASPKVDNLGGATANLVSNNLEAGKSIILLKSLN